MAGNADHAVDYAAGMLMAPTSLADWLIVAPSLITIIGGASLVMLRYQAKWHGYLSCLYLAALVIVDALLLSRVMAEGPITMTMGRWLPPFGITLVVDALGGLMALIAAIVALAVCVYSLADISVTSTRFGFYPALLWMMTGITGSFLTGDIFNLYVWFEVMLISSFGLLIVDGERIQLDGAMKYAVLNLMATTLFLVTTGYLYGAVGSLNMADIAMRLREMPAGAAPMGTIATLYLLAFSMKAAAFPVNFWLPASYHTPKIVVSAIFAGLLTKVGVYALIRTLVLVMPEGRDLLSDLIAWIAALTMIVGAIGALAQNDVRRTFGFLVVGGIGSSMVGVAVGTQDAITGAILYAVNSILVMTALYLAFGILMRKNGGKYNLSDLGGGYKASSWLSILFSGAGLCRLWSASILWLLAQNGACGIQPQRRLWLACIFYPSFRFHNHHCNGARLGACLLAWRPDRYARRTGRGAALHLVRDCQKARVCACSGAGRYDCLYRRLSVTGLFSFAIWRRNASQA